MSRARYLVVGHSGNENGPDLLVALIGGQLEQVDLMPRIDRVKPRLQFLSEPLPRLWERVAAQLLGQLYQLSRGWVNISPRCFFKRFPPLAVFCQALHQSGRGRSDHRSIHAVVQVAVLTDLLHAPAAAEHRCDRAVDRLHRFFAIVRLCKGKVITKQIVNASGDVLGILKVAVNKSGAFLLGQPLLQQLLPLAVIADQILDPHLVAVPARFVLPEILIGQAVSLLAVLACQHQNLILIAVVKAAAIGDDVVHVHIARFKQAGKVKVSSGIQAHAVLLAV